MKAQSSNTYRESPSLTAGPLYEYTVDLLCINFSPNAIQGDVSPDHNRLGEGPGPTMTSRQGVRPIRHRRAPSGIQGQLPAWCPTEVSDVQHGVGPPIIGEYLGMELSLGRMLGPFPEEAQGLPPLHINRFGVIPKGHNTGRWRLITDLSFPPGLEQRQ